MVEIVGAPAAGGIAMRTGQKTTNAASAFEAAAQVVPARVTDGGCVSAVALLDHSQAVVNVARFAGDIPRDPVGRVLHLLSQAPQPVINTLRPLVLVGIRTAVQVSAVAVEIPIHQP